VTFRAGAGRRAAKRLLGSAVLSTSRHGHGEFLDDRNRRTSPSLVYRLSDFSLISVSHSFPLAILSWYLLLTAVARPPLRLNTDSTCRSSIVLVVCPLDCRLCQFLFHYFPLEWQYVDEALPENYNRNVDKNRAFNSELGKACSQS
jgi:hypothetical protein